MAAEPLRNGSEYDPDTEPVTGPDLNALEGVKKPSQHPGEEAAKKRAEKKKGLSPQNLGKAEGGLGAAGIAGVTAAGGSEDQVGSGFSPVANQTKELGRFRKFFWGSRRRKQATVTGGVMGGGTIAVAFAGLSLLSGPAQAIQLSHVLQNGFGGDNQQTQSRLKDLFRDARATAKGDVGETRVGIIGSKIFGNTIKQLSDIGIEFKRDPITGRVQEVTINTKQLNDSYPELNGMSPTDKAAFLADKLNIPTDEVNILGDDSFSITSSDFGITAARLLQKNVLSLLEDGKLLAAIRFRPFAKFTDLPSIFHPLQRTKSAATYKLAQAAEATRESDEAEPAAEDAAPAEEAISSGLSGAKKTASGALLFTAAACLVRSVADDVVKFNRSAIVTPSTVQAVDKISVGSQIQSGQDFTLNQVGAITNGFTDSNGQTIWQGKALQTLEGTDNSSGTDLGQDYKQAFSIDTTAQTLDDTVGGGTFGALACSTPGQIIQALGSLGLAISGAVDDGASDVAWGALFAEQGAKAVATGGVLYLFEHQLVKLIADKAVIPNLLSGPQGGNLLAYGAREAGNILGRTGGGIALTATQALALDNQQQNEENQQFHSESFFARVFNINDYRSMFGKLADSLSPSIMQNVSNLANYFTNIGSSIPHIFSTLIPKASAASVSYDWGFPQYGIPQNILNDPSLSDPYENAGDVATLLDQNNTASQTYIDNALLCFGETISKSSGVWEVTPTMDVNPNSSDYPTTACDNTTDVNWQRIMLFILDTNTMEATGCYSGDAQSCTNLDFQ